MPPERSESAILILAANPQDTTQLRLDKEVREIDKGLQRSRNAFDLKQRWAATPADVRRAMLDMKPRFVHFCGHGEGGNGIVLEDNAGCAQTVDTEAFVGLFELFADKTECVLLNACYSEVQAEAISQHIKYVIGMNQAVGDEAAIEFAVAFYDALGAGESVEFAYKFGCNAIQMAGIPEHLTPVLKRKLNLRQKNVNPPQVEPSENNKTFSRFLTRKAAYFGIAAMALVIVIALFFALSQKKKTTQNVSGSGIAASSEQGNITVTTHAPALPPKVPEDKNENKK